jgi:hypothetical protein
LQVALKSDGVVECREISHQLLRARLTVTGPKNKGLADCSFAVKSGRLKSTNKPFLDIQASEPSSLPSFEHLLECECVTALDGIARRRGVQEGVQPLNCITHIAKF